MPKSLPLQCAAQIAIASILFSGCTSYTYRPYIRDRALERAGYKDDSPIKNYDDPTLRNTDYTITDRDVYDFENDLKATFRKKAVRARTWREISATAQILTAAAAATLLAVDGGATEIAAVLAGGSAVIPNLQKIFSAGERSQAFTDAVGLLEEAEGRFQTATAADGGVIHMDRLTLYGAHFAEEISATVRLMESSIAARIPKIEDMEKAHGVRLNTLKVSSDFVQFQPGAAAAAVATVSLPGGEAVASVDSSNQDVVTVNSAGSTITFTPGHPGTAKVTVIGQSGASAEIIVDIPLKLQSAAAVALGNNAQISIPAGGTAVIDAPNSTTLLVSDIDTAKLGVMAAGNQVTLTPVAGVAPARTSVTLINENGAKRKITVNLL